MNNSIYAQLILLNKNDTDHYLKRYVKLVSFYKERNLKKVKGLHHEHHIIPKSFGGPDTGDNLVCITNREHFILHWMLYKAFPKSSMVTSFFGMCSGWKHYSDNKITSKVHEKLMLEFRERQSENMKQIQNKRVVDGTHPWQDKEKQSQRAKKRVEDGNHNFSGGEISRRTNKERLEDGTHPFLDKEKARQRANKRVADGTHNFLDGEIARKSAKKRVENGTHPSQIKKVCLYCNKEFSLGMFTRWHGDKCKLKPN